MVDLKGPYQPTLHTLMRCQMSDVFTQQTNAASSGWQHASEQIDERGFACTVGANQGMTSATQQLQTDVVRGGDATKTLDQALAG